MSLRIDSANCDFALGHDREYLEYLCAGNDVLLLQEMKNVIVADNLPEGWVSLQDETDQATRGSCVAYNAGTAGCDWHRLRRGVKPLWRGRRVKMLPRHIAVAILYPLTDRTAHQPVASAHLPPGRFSFLDPRYIVELRAVVRRNPGIVVGTDANMPIERLARLLGHGLKPYGKGIVGLLTAKPVRDAAVRPWGKRHGFTDHPDVSITV